MKMRCILSVLMYCMVSHAAPPSHFLIIHGTWSPPFDWHMPGGDFYDALSSVTELGAVSFFLWSGHHSHDARVTAAQQLIEYIQLHYPHDAELNLIGHSHGSNVGIIASQLMAKDPENKYKIHGFYALGTPTDSNRYMPDMSIINYFYNFFSFNDFIQPVLGFFGREYPVHERIANLSIIINGEAPIHTDLHHPLIARWIPAIHESLTAQKVAGFGTFNFTKPGIIQFNENHLPLYLIDTSRAQKIKHDKRILRSINTLHQETRKKLRHSRARRMKPVYNLMHFGERGL